MRDPSLAEVGGVPYVAWSEFDGTNYELRVARLDAAGGAWVQAWAGVSDSYGGINQSTARDALHPSVASIGGTPYVAWRERDGTNQELRVARLDAATNRWVQPWAGVSDSYGGINQRLGPEGEADHPSLASVGGVPYVAWDEWDDDSFEVRVARLDGDSWDQAWPGVSDTSGGINQSTTGLATPPSLASVGGVPYVAWSEFDGTNYELRVARLDDATGAWDQPWTGVSDTSGGINQSGVRIALDASVAEVDGVPYVAWDEYDGSNTDVRVARLSAGAWRQPWAGAGDTSGGIEQTTTHSGDQPSLAAVGGVAFVAWRDSDGARYGVRAARLSGDEWSQPWAGTDAGGISRPAARVAELPRLAEVGGVPFVAWREAGDTLAGTPRVARLEPELTSTSAVPSASGATLTAEVRTFGIPYPIGFEYGSAFEHETAADPAPAGAETVTVGRRVDGLAPGTAVGFRPFAIAGVAAPRVLGPPGAFTTLGTGAADTAPPAFVGRVRVDPRTFAVTRRRGRARSARPRRGTTFRYRLSEPARVVFTVERRVGRRFARVGAFAQRAGAGANARRFSGRIGGRKLRPGRYRAILGATDAAGNRSRAKRAAFKVVRGG
jgi:hypothetical protein